MVVGEFEVGTDILVIGAGPAGYTAAIKCAEGELDTTLAGTEIGGICLNHGCIPFKAIMNSLDLAESARSAGKFGVRAENVSVDMGKVQEWKEHVVGLLDWDIKKRLTASGVQFFQGTCAFTSSTTAIVRGEHGFQHLRFKQAVIATGAQYTPVEGTPFDGVKIFAPDQLAQLKKLPASAAVLGGGVPGARSIALLQKAGTKLTIAFQGPSLIPSVDDDVLRPLMKSLGDGGAQIFPGSSWQVSDGGKTVTVSSGEKKRSFDPELVVLATPLVPGISGLNLKKTKVQLDDHGFIRVAENFRTTDSNIYAIGDVLGGEQNAAVAFRQGFAVGNLLSGKPGLPDYEAAPLTINTVPPIACAGTGENEAKKAGFNVITGISPYMANGAAVASESRDGLVKVIAEKTSHRILGVQAAGNGSPDFIGEGVLAIEMGARLEDVMLTLHPHPEYCEELQQACAIAVAIHSKKNR